MADCKTCKENRIKDKNSNQYDIDIVSTMALITNRRLFIIILALIVALIGTNCFWIYREMQYEDISVSQEVDTGDGDAIVAGVGDVNYGENQAESESTQTENGR
jgi:hypothetical protein